MMLTRVLALVLAVASAVLLLGPLAGARSSAQEVLTNDSIVGMVKAGLPESVIISKIGASGRKFDTSTDGLIKLKAAKVPDKVIEAMITGGAPAAASAPASQADPMIAYVSSTGATPLKIVHGEMETSAAPFAGVRQEVVLPTPRAEYRITDRQPVFSTNLAAEQWALIRLKPGKKDRNLPINNNSGWGWGGSTFRTGPDPKYRVALEGGPGPDGVTRIKPKEPLAPGEYGLIAIVRGQPNMVEVFEFGVD
ncbi:MAG: hypothetical protein HY216_13205 [Candidatus Rokubacteria bacterium]|nr:hypothetical protein [Candidatus Rokubacteria bacterium]